MAILLGILSVIFLAAAALLLVMARQIIERAGVPAHSLVVYCDTGAWSKVEDPLFSSRYGLTGKPDYIVRLNGEGWMRSQPTLDPRTGVWGAPGSAVGSGVVVPLELKPNRSASTPRESDVMQLAAYGLLVEQVWGVTPPYGLLKYRDAIFRIEFDAKLMARLLDLMCGMRRDLTEPNVPRSHMETVRCRDCGYHSQCDQALAG